MDTPQLNEEAQKLRAEAERNEGLLTQVITGPAQAGRMQAARDVGILSPVGQQPTEARVVIRLLRTDDGRWWGCFEGVNGVVSQAIHDTPMEMMATLGAASALVCNAMMTDDEHTATTAALQEATRG